MLAAIEGCETLKTPFKLQTGVKKRLTKNFDIKLLLLKIYKETKYKNISYFNLYNLFYDYKME